jgi:aquaporin Z
MKVLFLKQYLLECVGTFFLVFTILSTGNPLAIGLILASAMYIGAPISGGHYNPAVTLSLWLRGTFSLIQIPGYVLSQISGAFIAGVFYYYLFGKIVFPAPLASLGIIKPLLIEVLGTFIFCSVFLESTTPQRPFSPANGLIIGLSLTAISFMGGALSGGAFNPAAGLGPILFDVLKGGLSYSFLPIYLLGPLGGGILASIFYLVMHNKD